MARQRVQLSSGLGVVYGYAEPGLYRPKERLYPTPWLRCDREADYHTAWTRFSPLANVEPIT